MGSAGYGQQIPAYCPVELFVGLEGGIGTLALQLNESPAASFADTSAIGKPVAFEAKADERDVLGLISITITRPVLGSWAN